MRVAGNAFEVSMPGMFGIVGEDSIPMALTRKRAE